MPMRVDETLAIAALIQATVVKLYQLHAKNQGWRPYSRALIMENKWRAARYGIDGTLIDFGREKEVPERELLEEYLEFVDDVVDELGSRQEVEYVRWIMEHGTGADRQLAEFSAVQRSAAGGGVHGAGDAGGALKGGARGSGLGKNTDHAVTLSDVTLSRCRGTSMKNTVLATLMVVLVGANAFAQAPATHQKPYEPTVGQGGKDVVWVPTPAALVEKMLDMAKVTPHDVVMDLGSGDGRNIIAAAKRGARAIGVEYNPDMVALSNRLAAEAGVAGKATFVEGDMFTADISRATVMALFLLPDNLERLRDTFAEPAAGHPDGLNTFAHSGMGTRCARDHRGRLRELVHVAALLRAGQGRRHVEDVARRPRRSPSRSRWSPARSPSTAGRYP